MFSLKMKNDKKKESTTNNPLIKELYNTQEDVKETRANIDEAMSNFIEFMAIIDSMYA